MEAWQLLQGNIPSVIGGEVYSSTTALAEKAKKSSRNSKVTAAKNGFMLVLVSSSLNKEICKVSTPIYETNFLVTFSKTNCNLLFISVISNQNVRLLALWILGWMTAARNY
jgi:hypothetical protein